MPERCGEREGQPRVVIHVDAMSAESEVLLREAQLQDALLERFQVEETRALRCEGAVPVHYVEMKSDSLGEAGVL